MADVEEIRVYLESHPEDHKQRWRLAKKLYGACDYSAARDQLLLLREAWPNQIPVARYLAATHYRLGQYDAAADVLVQTIKQHPADDSLLEQLAKIHEGSGQFKKALDVWKRIAAIKPGKSADEAIERLRTALGATAASTVQMVSAPSDTLRTCPHCGEGNDVFRLRCIRCDGELVEVAGAKPPQEAPTPFMRGAVVIILFVLLLLLGVSVALFFWLR